MVRSREVSVDQELSFPPSHARTNRDDVREPTEGCALSTNGDRANDGVHPNRRSGSIPDGVCEPRLGGSGTTSHRGAIHDAGRSHPRRDDTRRRAPEPELPKEIPLSLHWLPLFEFSLLYLFGYGLHEFRRVLTNKDGKCSCDLRRCSRQHIFPSSWTSSSV
jgi:hypothetical protein